MSEVTELLVLHTVRLTGVVTSEAAAARLDADQRTVDVALGELRAAELVQRRTGALTGWSLTAAGRRRGEQLLAEELDRLGVRPDMEVAYEGFLELNQPVLQVCSDWQVVAGAAGLVLNDHTDPAYDTGVLERLAVLHDRSRAVLDRAVAALDRFGHYPPRLDHAVTRACAGGLDWVTKPLIDSFHTVWFELHEDLLATLGRQRADERENGQRVTAPPPGGPADAGDEDTR